DQTFLNDEKYSFVFDLPITVEAVEIYNDNGDLQDFYQRDYYKGTALLYQKSFSDLKGQNVDIQPVEQLLYQNYPNPFFQYTTIEYHISELANVKLQLMDMFGRVVMELVNEQQAAGIYQFDLRARDLKSGIYFYRIHVQSEQGYYTATKKMIIK
ncbi:MAG: T9SS type A sorting domain-containing protein, partial [Bacteroidales bacterium]|nr:T9SS type A sorting domain-containing protein [Bacteroidales bacterium]